MFIPGIEATRTRKAKGVEGLEDGKTHLRRGNSGNANAREMDYESFLDFVLAQENKDSPEGITNLNGRGFLTTADIHTLFRDVHQKWIEGGSYELCIRRFRELNRDM
ncbi:probable serine/threonine-protein phosphatase 2A regulatory subunit B'' subunit TON2 [Tanacetum coccineum]|uniref:Probable serine/threonine-protein phosphatase 2A regulatory subunit B'' subunit TON2 n=1 Tax=Tanacetum coccineum TaxID=301880 RepID=A0ABQ4ZYI8_9ASTR